MSASPASSQREFAREELSKELLHDYSTSSTGVVPLAERRSLYHFVALWMTLAAGSASPASRPSPGTWSRR